LIPLLDLRPAHHECWEQWLGKLAELLETSQWILGPEVAAFESEFARFCGAPSCVGTASGTDAITMALRLCGIREPEQEVITSPLTAPFTGIAILAAGARPVFADVDEETLLLDPAKASHAVTARTAALLPVHLYGQTCDLVRFGELAEAAGVVLIQDACQAHGAWHHGRPLTAFSPYVAWSFYPTKNLGALGDAGALCLSRENDVAAARQLRDGGRLSGHVSHVRGLNSRLDELQAAFLRIGLPRLAERNQARRKLAAIYDEELASMPAELVRPVARASESDHVFHLYVVRASRRDELRAYLGENRILTGVHYPVPLHLQPVFQEWAPASARLPIAETAAREILSLPMGPHLKEDDVRRVCASIRTFYGA
jgi:dTDP-3-amino-3,4,6-trideoxy-alpha-D-glucose transaminase